MTEHGWELDMIEGSIFRNTDDGLEFMDLDEAERRINAVERLSAGFAADSAGMIEGLVSRLDMKDEMLRRSKALRAYANILEGK